MKQNDAAYKIVRSGRHFQVPRAVQGVGSCYSNCEGAKKQGGLTKKTYFVTKVTETIMDHISEMSNERVKLFNRESEALRRMAEYWLIILIKK